MNLNPAARQRHQVRVITIGFFRMLKSMQTYKVIKTKSEIAALIDFLEWLESQKNDDPDSKGIVLIYHEERKFLPYMMLEAFKKYNLLQRFLSTVHSFANGFDLAEIKCPESIKYFSLRQLSKVLLNGTATNNGNSVTATATTAIDDKTKGNDFEGNASVRARLAYEIAQHLSKGEVKDMDGDKVGDSTATDVVEVKEAKKEEEKPGNIADVLHEFAHPVSVEIDELRDQRKILERQNSLRPVFLQFFKTTLFHRVKAVTYRRVLAENSLDFEMLQKMWEEGKKVSV